MNIKLLTYYALITFAFFVTACQNNKLHDEMERIKEVGNTDPELALKMLDSMEVETVKFGTHDKHVLELLKIRLHDKAYHLPASDEAIRNILPYFERYGSVKEKQEAYFYAGSVYRDLQDTPQALQYFYLSQDCFNESPDECDSLLLRNTFSDLHYLYYTVQDYENAMEAAKKELEIDLALAEDPTYSYLHIASDGIGLRNKSETLMACDSAFKYVRNENNNQQQYEDLTYLLCYYTQIEEKKKAEHCYNILMSKEHTTTEFGRLALAKYHTEFGDIRNGIEDCKKLYEESNDIYVRYEAAKQLFSIYNRNNEVNNALKYAKLYKSLSDSIDFGKRQELSATVRNQYKYQKDRERESKLEAENQRFNKLLVIASASFVIILCGLSLCYVVKRNQHLKRILKLTEEIKENKERLQKQKQLLTEKIEQNRRLMRLLHQAELEDKAEEVVSNLNRSSNGLLNMTKENWKQLYNAVDELYPTFKDAMIAHLGDFTEQHMQVCYLMRIGLTSQQIQNITNLSRATVWRWTKRFSWVNEQ